MEVQPTGSESMPDMEQLKALLDAYQQTGSRRLGPVPEDLQVRACTSAVIPTPSVTSNSAGKSVPGCSRSWHAAVQRHPGDTHPHPLACLLSVGASGQLQPRPGAPRGAGGGAGHHAQARVSSAQQQQQQQRRRRRRHPAVTAAAVAPSNSSERYSQAHYTQQQHKVVQKLVLQQQAVAWVFASRTAVTHSLSSPASSSHFSSSTEGPHPV
jgi:hypothetical protein